MDGWEAGNGVGWVIGRDLAFFFKRCVWLRNEFQRGLLLLFGKLVGVLFLWFWGFWDFGSLSFFFPFSSLPFFYSS